MMGNAFDSISFEVWENFTQSRKEVAYFTRNKIHFTEKSDTDS